MGAPSSPSRRPFSAPSRAPIVNPLALALAFAFAFAFAFTWTRHTHPAGGKPAPMDDDLPKKTSPGRWVMRGVLFALGAGSIGFWAYGKYVVKKEALGGPCTWDMHCQKEAPRCMRESGDEAGACSRPCDLGADCAEGIACVSVELDTRDERGMPILGGYCVPRALLDKKRGKPAHDASPADDGLVAVPHVAGQLEGELTVKAGAHEITTWQKGTLVRAPGDKPRVVVDTSTARVFVIDDERKTFAAHSADPMAKDVTFEKKGGREVVAGVPCETFEVHGPKWTVEGCASYRGGFAEARANAAVPAWLRELAARGAIPLRASLKEGKDTGKDGLPFQVLSVVERPMAAELFVIPKGYKNLAQKR